MSFISCAQFDKLECDFIVEPNIHKTDEISGN